MEAPSDTGSWGEVFGDDEVWPVFERLLELEEKGLMRDASLERGFLAGSVEADLRVWEGGADISEDSEADEGVAPKLTSSGWGL